MDPKTPEGLLRHAGWLRALARSLVSDAETAEDLVQDTWVATLSQPPEREPGPWLRRVLHNAACQHWRGDARRRRRERMAARSEELPSSQEMAERMELQKRIIDCVQELAEPYRSAIVLRFYEGLSAAEIARRKRLPAATVRSRIARGLAELRRKLDRRHGGREAWSAVLLPWLDAKPAIASGIVLALANGILSMSTASKLVLSAAAAATLAIVGYRLVPLDGPNPPSALAQHPADAERIRADDPQQEETPVEDSERRLLTVPAAPPDAASISEDSLRARIVDAQLQPLSGALLSFGSLGIEAESDADGVVRMSLELRTDGYFGLNARLDGYATKFFGAELDADALNDLGEIVLRPGGSIAGRVEDARGTPLAGAQVLVGEARARFARALSRHAGPDRFSRALETLSGHDGRFELSGVAAGPLRIWAGHESTLWFVTDPIELDARQSIEDLVLRLEPLETDDVLSGVLFGADGRPVADATIRQDCRGAGIYLTRFTSTDAEGRFRLLNVPMARNDLRAEDPEDRWSDVSLRDASPGVELQLQFVATRLLPVHVLGSGGAPLAEAEVSAIAVFETDSQSVASGQPDADTSGLWTLREPAEDYRIRVLAPGYAATELGTFPSGSVPIPIEVQLEAAATIHGRVLADERPVSGARVELYSAFDDLSAAGSFQVVHHHGILVGRSPYVEDAMTTGPDGRFSFTPREPGGYWVWAEHGGYAASELEVRDFSPDSPSPELELRLTSGGTIEGRVIPAPGEDAAGTQVVASRGDGKHRVQRVGADGRFRFETLTPGAWDVRAIEDDLLNQQSTTHTISKTKPELPFVCEVVAGQTTQFDVDLSEAEPCVVLGRVTVDGRPAAGWSAELRPRDGYSGLPSDNPNTTLDALGRFELATQTSRAHILLVRAPGDEELTLGAELDLRAGVIPWELEFETGRIEIENLSASTEFHDSPWLLWRGPEASVAQRLQPDENGRCVIPRFPVGEVSVMRYRVGPSNPQSGRQIGAGRVERGKTTRLVIR